MKKIITKQEAKSLNLKRYFTGVNCKHGHLSEFFVKGSCCTCALLKIQAKRLDSEFRKKEIQKDLSKRKSDNEYHEKRKANSKNWWLKNKSNPDFIKEQKEKNKSWSQSDNGKIWIKNYTKNRNENNPTVNMASRVRSRLKEAFRNSGYLKNGKTSEIIGCSFEELKIHIEKQFLKGMNWKNKNLWHIDHIIPLATAKNPDEIIQLSHFTNMRPFWALDNLQKNRKVLNLI